MAPKHPYIDEASKGAFLAFLKNGKSIPSAAKKAKINIKIARDIKKRADKIIIYYDDYNLPSPFFYDRIIIAPKSERPYIFSEFNINILNVIISSDRHHREMQ
jgi:hypothetical protein